MRRVAQGDAIAFGSLFERHYDGVLRFLGSRTGRQDDVEDVAQATFLQVWRTAREFRGESSVSTYLKSVAMNLHRQNRARVPHSSASEGLESAAADKCSSCRDECSLSGPEAASCRAEREAQVLRAVAALPEQARQAIRLRILEQRGAAESASLAGCSLRSLERYLAHGLAILREKLEGLT
jgi:RNA polymerase sigma-70 factor, ECF subfamily